MTDQVKAYVKKHHTVKCVQPFFELVWQGLKPVEIRKDDRDYQSGDVLIQKEYIKDTDSYSERFVTADILYAFRNLPELPSGYVMLVCVNLTRNYLGVRY